MRCRSSMTNEATVVSGDQTCAAELAPHQSGAERHRPRATARHHPGSGHEEPARSEVCDDGDGISAPEQRWRILEPFRRPSRADAAPASASIWCKKHHAHCMVAASRSIEAPSGGACYAHGIPGRICARHVDPAAPAREAISTESPSRSSAHC